MKRYGRLLAAVLCLLLLFGGCSGSRTKLTLGFDSHFPPYGYIAEDGSYTGFDIDMAREVCRLEHWELELTPINWDEKDTLLNNGAIDCIWNGFTINGREDEYTISLPYCCNHQLVTVGAGSSAAAKSDLKGMVVGVQAASSIAEYLLGDPEGIKLADTFGLLAQFSDFSAAYAALENGTLDAVIADEAATAFFVERNSDLRVLEEPVLKEWCGVAFKKGNTELCDIINRDLKKLAADGTVARLAEQYEIADMICIE